jgi:hypothetical protein
VRRAQGCSKVRAQDQLAAASLKGDHHGMLERNVGESTFPVIRLPLLQRLNRGFQISFIALFNLVIGLVVGDFVGAVVGYRWPCTIAGGVLGLVLGIASVRALVLAATAFSVSVDANHLRLVRRVRKGGVVSVRLEDVRSIEERGKGDV